MIKIRLGELLMQPESFDWKFALYLPSLRADWSLDVMAILEDPDDVESDDPDAIPESVIEAEYRYVLSMQDVRGVVNNARFQGARLSERIAFEALLFFLDHDAFQIQD